MSASNNERPWAPAELDALEDALDSLELAAPPALPGALAPEQQHRIAERLASYRAIAGLSRELLTAHVAPASAIAAALAEARSTAAAGGSPIAAPLEPTATSWWSRAKRLWLVPTLASAGVGALVVVLAVDRTADAPESAVVATNVERKADSKSDGLRAAAESRPTPPLAMAEPEGRADDDAELTAEIERGSAAQAGDARGRLLDRKTKAIEQSDAPAKGEREEELARKEIAKAKDEPEEQRRSPAPTRSVVPASPPAEPAVDPAPPTPEPKQPSAAPNKGPKKPSTGGPSGGKAPGGGADADPSAAALGDILVRADRARKSGDCDAARRDYAQVIAKGDRKQRARAKAGTALCLEQAGANGSAEDLIAGARLDDPGIDAWLSSERRE